MADPALALVLKRPFAEQVAFFRRKLGNLVPTQRWDDLWKSAHDTAFMVAGAQKADLLADLASAVEKAIVEGIGIGEFRKQFDAAVDKAGWSYTGERNWRTRVIYQTNISTSYAAGREAQIAEGGFPFKMYKHSDSVVHPRPLHQSWDGLVLPVDHPFWQTHSAPNGWGCKCRIIGIRNQAAARRLGGKWGSEPPDGWDDIDAKTGEPVGIDKGWGYQPGASVLSTQKQMRDKAKQLPKPLGDALAADVAAVAPKFVPQKTAKAAAKWAVDNDLADFADYGSVKPEVANAWNQSLFEHVQEFPELRKNQKFTGTAQAQFSRWRQLTVQSYADKLVARGASPDTAKAFAELNVKRLKNSGDKWAHSWDQPDVSGIAVNEKWGKDVDVFKRALTDNVTSGFHPVGGDTIKSVVDHELGHQLDTLLGLASDNEINAIYSDLVRKNGVKDAVSEYARKNIKEFIAEGWAEFRNNPSPRDVARTIGGIVQARYRFRFNP